MRPRAACGSREAGNDNFTIQEIHHHQQRTDDPGVGSDSTSVANSTIGDDLIVEELTAAATTDTNTINITNCKVTDYVSVAAAGQSRLRMRRNASDRLFAHLYGGDDWLTFRTRP